MMNKTINRMGADQKHYLLSAIVLVIGIGLWISTTFYVMQQKIDQKEFEGFINQYSHLSGSDLLQNDNFLLSYIGIHDPAFFNHRGIHFSSDVRRSFRNTQNNKNLETVSLTRQIVSQIVTDGKWGGIYRNYMIPLMIERELNKQSILNISIHLRQEQAKVTYDQVLNWLKLRNLDEFTSYHWILLHSLFESLLQGKTELYHIETLFFQHMTNLYSSGFVRDADIEEIYLRYQTDFAYDTALFFSNYRRATQSTIRQTRLGGAIHYAELARFYAEKYAISYPLFLAVIQSESNGDPKAISRAGALGLAQIMPATARDVTNNPSFRKEELFHPEINLDIAAQYIRTIKGWVDTYYPDLDPKRRIDFIASAYNAGWSRVRRANGIPNILETRNYVQRVHHYNDLYEQYYFATAQI